MRKTSSGLVALVVWLGGCQGATLPGSTAGVSDGMDSDPGPEPTSGTLPPPTASAGLDTSTGPADGSSTGRVDSTTDTGDDRGSTSDGSTSSGDASSSDATSDASSSSGSSSGGPSDDCQPILVEVLYDLEAGDDLLEWVRLHNPCETPRDLMGHSLAWGGTDYAYGTLDLVGVIPPGGCFTVGGPMSNATNGSPVLDQAADLVPDLQNSGITADGVALFDVPASDVAVSVPIDAVIYGTTNDSGLLGPDGMAPAPHVADAPAGSALRRTSPMATWVIDAPMPGTCPPF